MKKKKLMRRCALFAAMLTILVTVLAVVPVSAEQLFPVFEYCGCQDYAYDDFVGFGFGMPFTLTVDDAYSMPFDSGHNRLSSDFAYVRVYNDDMSITYAANIHGIEVDFCDVVGIRITGYSKQNDRDEEILKNGTDVVCTNGKIVPNGNIVIRFTENVSYSGCDYGGTSSLPLIQDTVSDEACAAYFMLQLIKGQYGDMNVCSEDSHSMLIVYYTEKGYDNGYEVGYNEGHEVGHDSGYTDGYTYGRKVGYAEGEEFGFDSGYYAGDMEGYDRGYTEGHNEGYMTGLGKGQADATSTIGALKDTVFAIFDAPVTLIDGMLNFDLFGINLLSLVKTIITLAVVALIVLAIIKFIF